jgi:hypothetical protein
VNKLFCCARFPHNPQSHRIDVSGMTLVQLLKCELVDLDKRTLRHFDAGKRRTLSQKSKTKRPDWSVSNCTVLCGRNAYSGCQGLFSEQCSVNFKFEPGRGAVRFRTRSPLLF